MGVRKLVRSRQEVEVIKLIDQVLSDVALRLQEPSSPVTVDQLPVSIDVDGVPAVVQSLAGYCHTGPVVDTLRPPSYCHTRQTCVAK